MPKTVNLKPAASWQELRSTDADWNKVGEKKLLRMLAHMHVVRTFEERLLELGAAGLVHGPVHSSIGQDSAAVAVMAHLGSGDHITGSHRGHHQFLAKCLNHVAPGEFDTDDFFADPEIDTLIYRTFAEIMGLSEGYCGGRGGSMHLRWEAAGALGTNAIVGGGVPIAAGVAMSDQRAGQGDVTFSFLGDGAINIGAVPESMNLAALWQLPICFFIENNGYAVSTTLAEETHEPRLSSRGLAYGIPSLRVDGMDPVAVYLATEQAVKQMRKGGGPVIIEADLYRYLHHSGPLPGSAFGYRSKEEEAGWRERDPIARVAREMITRGWLTESQNQALRERAQTLMRTISARLLDDSGKQIRPEKWPDVDFVDKHILGSLEEFSGESYQEIEQCRDELVERNFVDAIADVMQQAMQRDERIFCLGEDIHRLKGGTNGATRGLANEFPGRILPTPIAEQGFIGMAGGVAMAGKFRPVVEMMYADFALVAADQLFNQIAKARHMFGGDMRLPLVLRTKCAIGTGYGAQHSMDPAGLFAQWPGWRIVAPSNPYDYVGLMNSALHCEDPVLVIEHVDLYTRKGAVPVADLSYKVPLGQARVARRGNACTVLTYLSMTQVAMDVAERNGLDAEVVDLRSLDRAGLDWQTIGESIKKTNNVVILEQGSATASYGALLSDEIQRRFFDYLDQPVKRIHGGVASPSVSKVLERAAFVGSEEIEAALVELLRDCGQVRESA